MDKNFLVTISSATENLAGIMFICNFFNLTSDHKLTLLHILKDTSLDMESQLVKMWKKDEDGSAAHLPFVTKKAIAKAKEMLDRSNISIEQVITKTVEEKFGTVRDILTEGGHGLYDAIILGKRASYDFQWVFERAADEFAQSIIKDSSFSIPLWICPETDSTRKNVLVCIDGSSSSYRAVDHTGYILADQDLHNITLFHMRSPDTKVNETEIFNKSEQILSEHGISKDRISLTTTWGLSIAKNICQKATQEKFSAIAMGLHGQPHGILKNFKLVSGTTSAVIANIEKTSVWCCP